MAESSTETTVQWILRDREEKMVSAEFHPDFHARVKEYCEAPKRKSRGCFMPSLQLRLGIMDIS